MSDYNYVEGYGLQLEGRGMEHLTCGGLHHFYVADTGVVLDEGKVVVILVCTACGEGKLHEFKVAGQPQLKSQTKEK